jgi:hypothetical protein
MCRRRVLDLEIEQARNGNRAFARFRVLRRGEQLKTSAVGSEQRQRILIGAVGIAANKIDAHDRVTVESLRRFAHRHQKSVLERCRAVAGVERCPLPPENEHTSDERESEPHRDEERPGEGRRRIAHRNHSRAHENDGET